MTILRLAKADKWNKSRILHEKKYQDSIYGRDDSFNDKDLFLQTYIVVHLCLRFVRIKILTAEKKCTIYMIRPQLDPVLSFGFTTPSGGDGRALYPLTALFSHSCAPNVQHTMDLKTGTVALTAQRSVAEGEELTISYINHMQGENIIGKVECERVKFLLLFKGCQVMRVMRLSLLLILSQTLLKNSILHAVINSSCISINCSICKIGIIIIETYF